MKPVFTRLALLALVAVLAVPTTTQAQGLKIGPQLGFNMDGSDLFIGLESQFDVPLMEDREVWGNLGLDFYPFIKNVTLTNINVDVLFPFGMGNLQFYGGGGLLMSFASYDLPENSPLESSDTDIALNVKGGLLLGDRNAGYRPFVELDQAIGAGSDLALRVGIFMTMGGGQ